MSTTQRRRAIVTVLVAVLALGLGACGKKPLGANDPGETGSGGFGQVAGGPTTPVPPVSTPRPAPTSAAPTGYTLLAPVLQNLLLLVTLQPLPLGSGKNLLFKVVKSRLGEPHAIQELGTD